MRITFMILLPTVILVAACKNGIQNPHTDKRGTYTAYKRVSPNIDSRVSLDHGTWAWDGATPKTIKSFELSLRNETSDTLCNIKYRLELGIDYGGSRFTEQDWVFSKAYTYVDTIYPHDIVRIPVKDLVGLHLGVPVKNCENEQGVSKDRSLDYWGYRIKITEMEQIIYRAN